MTAWTCPDLAWLFGASLGPHLNKLFFFHRSPCYLLRWTTLPIQLVFSSYFPPLRLPTTHMTCKYKTILPYSRYRCEKTWGGPSSHFAWIDSRIHLCEGKSHFRLFAKKKEEEFRIHCSTLLDVLFFFSRVKAEGARHKALSQWGGLRNFRWFRHLAWETLDLAGGL